MCKAADARRSASRAWSRGAASAAFPRPMRRPPPACSRPRSSPPTARPASATDFWWAGNTDEVGAFWHAYTSAWMPASLLKPQNQARLVDVWFAASRHWVTTFHFNKGLAGADGAAIEATRNTAMNPDVLD